MRGNERLINLSNLDWDEIKAIKVRGTECLSAAGYGVSVQAAWQSMIQMCKKYRRPIDRQWLDVPCTWAAAWPVGARLLVRSRGYLAENTVQPDGDTRQHAAVKSQYESEFRHDRSPVEYAMGLEDIRLRAADGSVLLPDVPESRKPWSGFPGGKQAFLKALLARSVQVEGVIDDVQLREDIEATIRHM